MFTRESRTIVGIAVCIFLLRPSLVFAETPDPADESPAKLAQQVYESLLEEYRGGKTGLGQLELLNNWSIRILLAELSATALGDGLAAAETTQQSMGNHFARMRTLEDIVEQKVDAGLVRRSDLLAARYFHRLNIAIENLVKEMQQQLQPPEIKLPDISETRPLVPKPPAIVIDIDAKGRLFVKGKELTFEQLNEQLQKVAKDNPQSTVRIRAHPECAYANVVRVLDVSNKATLSISLQVVGDKSEELRIHD